MVLLPKAKKSWDVMILLNFSHPLTPQHLARIAEFMSEVPKVIEVPTQFDHNRPFTEQVADLADGLGFSSRQWQTESFLINPPTLNVIAVTLLAELHGRMGHFPTVLRLKPVQGSTPPQFEVAEVMNLQAIRDRARSRRE